MALYFLLSIWLKRHWLEPLILFLGGNKTDAIKKPIPIFQGLKGHFTQYKAHQKKMKKVTFTTI